MRLVGLGLMVAVVVAELKKPAGERQWEGKVAGVVPYALRFPTPERIWPSVWNPDDPHLIVPRGFGVGWRLNLAAATSRLEWLFGRLMGPPRRVATRGAITSGSGARRGSRTERTDQSPTRSRTNSSARP
jgi:hypothetical protein